MQHYSEIFLYILYLINVEKDVNRNVNKNIHLKNPLYRSRLAEVSRMQQFHLLLPLWELQQPVADYLFSRKPCNLSGPNDSILALGPSSSLARSFEGDKYSSL